MRLQGIDGWQLTRSGQWTKAHTRFVRIVLKKLEKRDTEIVYLRGNHDDILESFLPLEFENLRIVEDYIHDGVRGRYLVLHGDVFDTITRNFVFLAHLGDWGYRALLRLNRLYNAWRAWRGKEYWTLSKAIKARDGGCAFPQCTIPAPWCEAHHINYWSRGGSTGAGNGTLLCSHHHHVVHKEQWTIQLRSGVPWFIPPPHVDPRQVPRRNRYFRLE